MRNPAIRSPPPPLVADGIFLYRFLRDTASLLESTVSTWPTFRPQKLNATTSSLGPARKAVDFVVDNFLFVCKSESLVISRICRFLREEKKFLTLGRAKYNPW